MGIFSMPFSDGSGNPLIGAIGFFMAFAGFALLVIGLVNYLRARAEWNLYFNMRDQVDNPDVVKRQSNMKKGKIMMIISIFLIILSLFIN